MRASVTLDDTVRYKCNLGPRLLYRQKDKTQEQDTG